MQTSDDTTYVWWVNQGVTYEASKETGCLWAPLYTNTGKPQAHWDLLTAVHKGDITVHCSKRMVVAIGRATSTAYMSPSPNEFGTTSLVNPKGRRIDVEYFSLEPPIPLDSVVEELRQVQPDLGPINKIHGVKQRYLNRFNVEGLRVLRRVYRKSWPKWAEDALNMHAGAARLP